jgi:carboxymethylenebutenolidase
MRETVGVSTGDGDMPVVRLAPEDPREAPALLVIPSIFGPAEDLVERLGRLEADACVLVTDPFWRVGPGPVPYHDFPAALEKVQALDRPRCIEDITRVAQWARAQGNGRVVGLGICFGGPFCLMGAAEGWLDGVVTWHGSRMENYLERAAEMRGPMRLHFGSHDRVTPPETLERIREAFAGRADVEIVVHEGCEHGYSHAGAAFDEVAADAGLAALGEVLSRLRGAAG